MKRAIIIGSGLGGLALGIRLQSAGVATTIVEARDEPGGCASSPQKDGFVFNAGHGLVTDPDGLRELWALSGRRMEDDVALDPVRPACRFSWPDGASFDLSDESAALTAEIARLAPSDLPGFQRLLDWSAHLGREIAPRFDRGGFSDFRSIARAAPTLARHQAWRSVFSVIASWVKNQKLREALSVHTLLAGGNPFTASAFRAFMQKRGMDGSVSFARGGGRHLVAALVAQFERLGGTIRLGDPAEAIDTLGDRATGVRTRSGWSAEADAIASNADIVHSYRDLLTGNRRGARAAAMLERKRFSPALFVLHMGIKGSWPGIPHQSVLFGKRYKGLLDDIFTHGVLPRDFLLFLYHPSVTDPSLAPEGCSSFSAVMPVAHMGKAPLDWDGEIGALIEERILDEIDRRLVPGIRSRVVTRLRCSPADFARDMNACHASAFSLEPVASQSAWFRVHNRDDAIPNLYFAGAGTHPGAGIPGVVASAAITAKLMLEDLNR